MIFKMKITIYTPTHNPKYLGELEDSIICQTHTDWEWVILTNNNASYTPKNNDKRIRVVQSVTNSNKIGVLKKEACSHAKGDILLEVDHDDLLVNNTLEEVNSVFEKNKEVGFVYSDNIKLSDKFIPYNKKFGWTFKKVDFKGKEYYAMNSFKPSPYRVSYIWFAPDHLRAWRKSVYDKIGGYNEELNVCDDQELMIRTYLETEFYHIEKPLYVYRILDDKSNTWIERNKEIQQLTKKLHSKYYSQLIDRYTELEGLYDKPRNHDVKITIITPTYNRPNSVIQRCIDSVKNQTFKDYEHIICSDGHEDRVKELVEKQNDNKLHYFSKKRTGKYGNMIRDTCLEVSHGDYVVFVDDDNIIFPKYLEVMYNSLKNSGEDVGFAVCDILHNGPLHQSIGKPPMILTGIPIKVRNIDTLQVMFKKKALINVGGWLSDKDYLADGYTLENINKFYKFYKINEVLGVHI